MKKLFVSEKTDLGDFSREGIQKIGKIALEGMRKDPKYAKQVEAIDSLKEGMSKETINVADSELYTTAISGFIEEQLRPKLVAAELIKVIDNFNTKGQNAIKVPIREALITASDLPDSGQLTHDTNSYTSTTITLTYKYASNQLTHEILKFANVDLISQELGEIGSALAVKMDSDIISALQTACTTANGNFTQLTGTSTVSYNPLVDAMNSTVQNYAEPDVILMNPSTFAAIMKMDEFKGGTSLVGSLMFKGDKTEHFPLPQSILNMRVVLSTQVDDTEIYLIDSKRLGYLVKAGGVETFDGRVSGYLAFEVIGAINYGVSVVQPKAAYLLREAA